VVTRRGMSILSFFLKIHLNVCPPFFQCSQLVLRAQRRESLVKSPTSNPCRTPTSLLWWKQPFSGTAVVNVSPGPLTYIQDSNNRALSSLAGPAVRGYELVFGLTIWANNLFGVSLYTRVIVMTAKLHHISTWTFTFIDRYDVDACVALCNSSSIRPWQGWLSILLSSNPRSLTAYSFVSVIRG